MKVRSTVEKSSGITEPTPKSSYTLNISCSSAETAADVHSSGWAKVLVDFNYESPQVLVFVIVIEYCVKKSSNHWLKGDVSGCLSFSLSNLPKNATSSGSCQSSLGVA